MVLFQFYIYIYIYTDTKFHYILQYYPSIYIKEYNLYITNIASLSTTYRFFN